MDSPDDSSNDFREFAKQVVQGLLGSPVIPELAFRLDRCHETALELRALVPLLLAVAKQRDDLSQRDAAATLPAAQRVSHDRRQAIMDMIDSADQNIDQQLKEYPIDGSLFHGVSERDAAADPIGIIMRTLPSDDMSEILMNALPPLTITTLDEVHFFRDYMRAKQRPPMEHYVSFALFARIVSDIEPTLKRLLELTLYARKSDGYNGLGDPNLEKAVNRAFGRGVARWRKAVSHGEAGSSVTAAITWEELTRVWEKRNLILHRGGVVDEAAQTTLDNLQFGELLEITEAELLDVIDLVAAIRMALILGAWIEQEPDSGAGAAESLSLSTVDEVRYGRWQLGRHLARLSEAFARTEEYRAESKILGWLALEKGFGRDAILEPVSRWSTNGLPKRFDLAKLILLHQDDRVRPLMARLLEEGEISEGWLTGPLFDRLRSEGWFDNER